MKRGTVFFRSGSILPESLSLSREEACDGWMFAPSNSAQEVDAKVRMSGWHFMCLNLASLQVRAGLTPATAIENAMLSALDHLNERFTTAELTAVTVRKYPGFYVARVTLASRHIQECASLGLVDEATFRVFPASLEAQAS